jgi:Family of unknown function (DUF6527)
MKLFGRLRRWIEDHFEPREFDSVIRVSELHDVPDDLDFKAIYVAGTVKAPKWAVFMCPCERPHRVTLSLQSSHPQRWRISDRRPGPTIFPSVDVRDWQRCHFWVKRGQVRWVPSWPEQSAS